MAYDRQVLRRRLLTPALALTLLAVAAGCDSGDGRDLPEPGPDQTASIAVTTTTAAAAVVDPAADPAVAAETPASEAADEDGVFEFSLVAPWQEAGAIPRDNTCDGLNISPSLSWSGVPAETVELAVVLTDLDADGYVHWVGFGIDPTTTGLASGEVPLAEALNSADTIGYTGPCPPSGTHAYLIELYAISQQIEYTRGDPAADVIAAIQAASLAQSSVIGTYTST